MQKQLLALFLFYIACINISSAQSISKTMLRLPDTGETSGYTATFGEDNDYSINAPFYINNGDGTITDTVTGLMWQQVDGGEMTIEHAHAYCDTLSLGGHTDWRLPNAHEAFSILNMQRANPAIDTMYFSRSNADYWWTSTYQVHDSNKVWATNAGGGIGNHPKTETASAGGPKQFHVRAVRAPLAPVTLPAHFTDNGDGTISDNCTGLVWQKILYNDTLTWEQALGYADTLTAVGKADWRLPNIKELQSLNDENYSAPSVYSTSLRNININKYWSSTTLPNHTAQAWYWDTQWGITTYDVKTARHALICVRNADISSAIQETKEARINMMLYPNPASHQLNIAFQLSEATLFGVCILDVSGRMIYSMKNINGLLGENTIAIDVSHFPAGNYVMELSTTKATVKTEFSVVP
jgi:Protein of unknown function (DUF1566)/Secretion system C-terminal sorting domain